MEFKWLWFIRMAVMSAFLLLECTTDACLEHERIALLQLKPFFNHYDELVDWDESRSSDCCRWKAIECNATTRRLVGLTLNSTRDSSEGWYLNASLFLPFVGLKRLYLRGNAIAGCIENEGFEKLSYVFGDLEILDLSVNILNDSIIQPLSELSSLRYLSLAVNQLEGSNHPKGFQWFSRLRNLETLDLSWNSLQSNIMFQLSSLSSLKNLSLRSIDLQGELLHIQGLNNLTNLRYLDLNSNGIESISKQDETQLRLTTLERLDLSSNFFRNETLSFLGGLPSLKSLDISSNDLQGSLNIKDLNYLTNLEILDLSSNKIKSFRSFKGDGTKLKLTNLKELYLNDNLFNTSVLASLDEFLNLTYLDMSNNLLEGSLDMKDLEAFIGLEELYMRRNQLTDFVLHEGWCDLKNLEVLDLSWNAFEGMFPHYLGNLTSLSELDISNNQFSGDLTPFANLKSLTYISLSKNHFQIPTSFAPLVNLPNLKLLYGDENNMVMEPSLHASIPKFQLNVISVSKCMMSQQLSVESLAFLHYQYDLRYVDLFGNKFSGKIPIWLLENNANLEYLILRGNALSGPLSLPSIVSFNVSSMDISDNELRGPIPFDICSTFPNLRRLFISKNAIEGNIPPCLTSLKNLSVLDLSNNMLSGRVPEEFIMKNSMRILRLSNNNLNGSVVPAILNANGLKKLYLDGNNFSGEMKDTGVSTFEFTTSLEEIDLSNNKLYGKLPRWIGNVSSLSRLALSNNKFDGSIPVEFCDLNELEFLELSQNNLSGSLPSCLSTLNIKHVHLHENRLSGPLSLDFCNSDSLVTLDLRGNNLSGSIPKSIRTLSSLSVLLLKANRLYGRIPVELCELQSLSIIDLSHNMFSGTIPSCLGNLTLPVLEDKVLTQGVFFEEDEPTIFWSSKLGRRGTDDDEYPSSYIEESIEFTTKSGSLSYGGKILKMLAGFDLSCNKLTGRIPAEFGNLSQIHSLNLSHNSLIGVIPSSFSKLKQLESLDLSYNNLAGKIPSQLVELNSLEVFSVAHNNLSGSIPEQKAQFGTFGESSYEGNPFLCGPMISKSCSKTDPPSTVSIESNDEEEDSLLDIYVFRVSFLASYAVMLLTTLVVLYINPYWRRVWFSFVERCFTACRYSIAGDFLANYVFRRCF